MYVFIDTEEKKILGCGRLELSAIIDFRRKSTAEEFTRKFDIAYRNGITMPSEKRDKLVKVFMINFVGYDLRDGIQKLCFSDVVKLSNGQKVSDENFLYLDKNTALFGKKRLYNDLDIDENSSEPRLRIVEKIEL